jgi:hypothetical protein
MKLTNWSVAIEKKRCGDIISPANILVPLSQTHTYVDAGGLVRSGYAAGDTVGGK